MAQIFISYSKQDIEFARHLRALLQAAGFEIWMDEERLVPSTKWWRTIEANIKSSAAFVVIMSSASAESRWVEREILVAENANISIFPVLLSGDGWSRLADIQFADFTAALNATLPPAFGRGLRDTLEGKAVTTTNIANTLRPQPKTAPQAETRLLEAAMPAETQATTETEVWAKVSIPSSLGLRGELPATVPSGDVIQKNDARTSSFPFQFPLDPRTGARLPARIALKATSSDFIVQTPGGDETESLDLQPDFDSRTVIFTLTPKQGARTSGRARVFIELIYEGQVIAQISVSTLLVAQISQTTSGVNAWELWSVPVGQTEATAGGYATSGAPPRPPDKKQDTLLADVLVPEFEAGDSPQLAEEAEAPFNDAPSKGEDDEVASPKPDFEGADADDGEIRREEESTRRPRVVSPPSPITPKPVPPPAADDERYVMPPMPSVPQTAPARQPSGSQSQVPSVPVRRSARILTLPALSAIAALLLVSVVFFSAMNPANNGIATTQTIGDTTNIALALTDNLDATRTSEAIQQGDEPTISLTEGIDSIWRTATQIFLENNGQVSPPPPLPLSSIGVTQLENCTTQTEATALSQLFALSGLEMVPFPGSLERIVTAPPDGVDVIFGGTCNSAGDVTLVAVLINPPEVTGVLHPDRVEITVPAAELGISNSAAAKFVRGVHDYMAGTFTEDLITMLLIAENVSPSLRMNLLLGNAYLFVDQQYESANARYEAILSLQVAEEDDADILIAAYNNAGVTLMNNALRYPFGSSDYGDSRIAAFAYFEGASVLATEPETQAVILLNRARFNLLVPGLTREDELGTALTDCQHAATLGVRLAEATVCEVAANFLLLQRSRDGSTDGCTAQETLTDLLSQLEGIPARDAATTMVDFWRGGVYEYLAACVLDETERAAFADQARGAYAQFEAALNAQPVVLTLDEVLLASLER